MKPSALAFLGLCLYAQSLYGQNFLPGSRTLMDAHNCYPYFEWWADRIDRALSAGTPLAIEQDPYWYTDPGTGKSWSIVAHGAPVTGNEPTLDTTSSTAFGPSSKRRFAVATAATGR